MMQPAAARDSVARFVMHTCSAAAAAAHSAAHGSVCSITQLTAASTTKPAAVHNIIMMVLSFLPAGTCILFGDGCGAVLLSAAPDGQPCSLLGVDMHSDGNGQKSLHAMYSGCGGKPFQVSSGTLLTLHWTPVGRVQKRLVKVSAGFGSLRHSQLLIVRSGRTRLFCTNACGLSLEHAWWVLPCALYMSPSLVASPVLSWLLTCRILTLAAMQALPM